MCILALITNYSARFPFILITNRDEVLDRLTYPLAVDEATGLLWAVDGVAGGSWLGVEPRSGRLATVTNCRRGPAAPLLFDSAEAEAATRQRYPGLLPSHGSSSGEAAVVVEAPSAYGPWRGAAPLSETLAHTSCVVTPSGRGTGRMLSYDPPTSRGTLIKEFLVRGALPGDGETSAWPASLRPPYYAGYNMVTCRSLFGHASHGEEVPFTARYTSNRFHGHHGKPLAHGTVHCLQNSFMDNWAEPKSVRLRSLFERVLEEAVRPLQEQGSPEGGGGTCAATGLAASDVARIASAFADTCLCDTPQFDVKDMARQQKEGEATSTGTSLSTDVPPPMTLEDLLRSTDYRLGFTAEELETFFPAQPGEPREIGDGGAYDMEAYLQRNIFVTPKNGYGTRIQSVVLTERCASTAGEGQPPQHVTHFYQRPVRPDGEGTVARCGPWVHYTVTEEGGAVQQA